MVIVKSIEIEIKEFFRTELYKVICLCLQQTHKNKREIKGRGAHNVAHSFFGYEHINHVLLHNHWHNNGSYRKAASDTNKKHREPNSMPISKPALWLILVHLATHPWFLQGPILLVVVVVFCAQMIISHTNGDFSSIISFVRWYETRSWPGPVRGAFLHSAFHVRMQCRYMRVRLFALLLLLLLACLRCFVVLLCQRPSQRFNQ